MPRTALDFIQVDDGEFASQFELDTVKDNCTGDFDPILMNNYALYHLANAGGQNPSNDSNFNFSHPNGNPYITIEDSTYVTFAAFIFRGTNFWSPSSVYIIASRKRSQGSSFFRIVDYTNSGNIIIEYNFSEEDLTLHTSLPPVSNLPSGPAIFEFQAKKSANNAGDVNMWAAGLYP